MKNYIGCKIGIRGMFIKNLQNPMSLEDGKGVTWWCWKGGGAISKVMLMHTIDGQTII